MWLVKKVYHLLVADSHPDHNGGDQSKIDQYNRYVAAYRLLTRT